MISVVPCRYIACCLSCHSGKISGFDFKIGSYSFHVCYKCAEALHKHYKENLYKIEYFNRSDSFKV